MISLMLGKHGIGMIKAGTMIGPGNNSQMNPMRPKEKERKETHDLDSLFEIEKKEEVHVDVPQPLTEQVFMATPEDEMSFLIHALTPTSMVLDLGCARAMTSWRAAKDIMEFCDQNPDCGL